jgi:peptide/nickel transport system permease protein
MIAFAGRRMLATVPVMFVVSLIVFSILHLSPGDPASIVAGDHASTEVIEDIRRRLGLDRPLAVQFGHWIWAVCRGDLGTSIFTGVPVTQMIGQRVEATLSLAVTTMIISICVAIPLGIAAAWRAGSALDTALMGTAVLAFSLPVFVTGYALVYVLAIRTGWFPVQGFRSLREGLGPFLLHIALPAVNLGLVYAALLARMTRSSMLEVLSQDYIRTARAKGLGTLSVLFGHALKNASIPIVTTIGSGLAFLLGGVVVTETVFGIPGLGRLVVEALLRRDFPVIQGVVLVISFAYLLLNLIIDLLYTFLDPRIRY